VRVGFRLTCFAGAMAVLFVVAYVIGSQVPVLW
jgi:hypothetical protein